MDLYIYYRVRTSDADAFQQKVTAMQRELHGSINAALKRRPDTQDDMHTWMEVYLATTPDFEARLTEAVIANGLPAFIQGPRHTEQFVDLSSCA